MEDAFGEDYYAHGEKERPALGEDADIHDVEQWLEKVKKTKTRGEGGASTATEDIEKALEDYYNLEFEDDIAGEKTRFRYTQVAPQSYGLTNEELLNMSEDELDQLIPIKKLATYREDEGHVKRQHIKYKRLLIQQQRKGLNPSSADASKTNSNKKKTHKHHSETGSPMGSSKTQDKKRKREDSESSDSRPPNKKRKEKTVTSEQ